MGESEYLSLALAGNGDAFGALVRLHQSRLRGFLRRLTRGDFSLADDLAQETFLEAWRKLEQFRGEGSFAGWLTRIGYSRYLMTARRRKLEPLEEHTEASETMMEAPKTNLDLESAMTKLSVQERSALTVCYALGHTNEEGAAILGVPLGTLKSHIARGREKLRKLLELE